MKILLGYPYYPSNAYQDVKWLTLQYIERLRKGGFDVEGFCLTIDPPANCIQFKELDLRWRYGDRKLLSMYEQLEKALEGKDVFINAAGINLHPEFVQGLKVTKVYGCNDDPESSEILSKPVASSYDACFVGNIAELDAYRQWGAKNVFWRPLGLMPEIYDPSLTYEQILNGERDIDLFMMIDKDFPVRKARMMELDKAFPDAHFYGKGWKRGYLDSSMQLNFLKRSKIGPNAHNSTGPINYRTFYLPANGVMQICDNKSHLGKIYELGKEVVGYDTIGECIELCRYYLNHDEERRKIAANGWLRATRDYNEIAIFKKDVENIRSILPIKSKGLVESSVIELQKRKTRVKTKFLFLFDLQKLMGSFWIRLKTKIKKIAGLK